MIEAITTHVWTAVSDAAIALAIPIPIAVLLGFIVKGRKLARDVIRAAHQARINVLMHFTDALLVAPWLAVLAVAMQDFFRGGGWSLMPTGFWDRLPVVVPGIAAVFLSDFIGYWRHRLEHTPLLWPSHAVHHSDTEMTWLAIFRFHPINRLTTLVIDFAFLLALGLPASALLVAATVKHFYGAFEHADLPWTFGPLKYVLVSPAMHRWHHAKDKAAYDTNYATVFSVFDLAFGTFRVPGVCDVPLGVPEKMGSGLIGQLAHPLKPSSYRYLKSRVGSWWRRMTVQEG